MAILRLSYPKNAPNKLTPYWQHLVSQNPYTNYQFSVTSSHLEAKKYEI